MVFSLTEFVEQTVDFQVIWGIMSLMFRHCNNVIVNIIAVAPGEHHAVLYQLHSACLFNGLFWLTTKRYQRFVLLVMGREPNNTRLYMVIIFGTFLFGANTSATLMTVIGILSAEHGRHMNCNGARQYQLKGDDYMQQYLVSPSHERHDIETLSISQATHIFPSRARNAELWRFMRWQPEQLNTRGVTVLRSRLSS